MHITRRYTHKHNGPVFPAGLSAFALLPHHLHTNTFCRGPGTNTRHSTFHYRTLIIVGVRGGLRACGEREGEEERKEGVNKREGESGRMTGSFISPRPENPFRTRTRSIEDISQTSASSLVHRHCSPRPAPLPFLFLHTSTAYPTSFVSSPSRIIAMKPFQEVSGSEAHHRFPACATGITQVGLTPGLSVSLLHREQPVSGDNADRRSAAERKRQNKGSGGEGVCCWGRRVCQGNAPVACTNKHYLES